MFIQANHRLALTSIPVTAKSGVTGLTKHTGWRAAWAAPCPAAGHVLNRSIGRHSTHDEHWEMGPIVEVSNLFVAVAALILLAVTSAPYGANHRRVKE
jgi:hypothetical protein